MQSIKKQKKTSFRDAQILLAINNLYKTTIINLLYYCINTYSNFDWNYDNIRNSITRLEKDKKIRISYENEISNYKLNNKIYKRNQFKLYIYKRC